jgi:hypothetical protein
MEGWTRAIVAVATGLVGALVMGLGPSPWPQMLGLSLVLVGLFWALVPLPERLVGIREATSKRRLLSWGVPLLLLCGLVWAIYYPLALGHMPWAAGQADHPTHQYQAWLLVERLLPSGRLTGWSDMRWAGYPALELYPIGGPLWVGLWRALTLGLLDWEATYAVAILAMVTANVVATYVATRRLAGPTAASIAAFLVLFERGWPRQGGDHYAIDVGVWPVTMGVGPLLLCLERQWSWISGKAGAPGLAAACAAASWALLCHPMYLPVLVLAAPSLMAVALVGRVRADRAAAGAVAPLVVGFLLAAFWYFPFLAHGYLSEPGGAPFRSLSNLGEGIAMASFVPRFWAPALVIALVGAVVGLVRGGGTAALTVIAIVLILAASSTPLELTGSLTDLSASVQQERFLIPLRVLLCILGGLGVAATIEVALGAVERWGFRQKLAAAGLILLVAPLAAPAVEGAARNLAAPLLELEQGDDLAHRRDLLSLCDWLRPRSVTDDGSLTPRTAWYVGFGHHEYNNAPIFCGLPQVIETPAETFLRRPGGISEREVRAFGVRWVVGDRPIEGRESYLTLIRRFGALYLYEVQGELTDRVTVLGPGQARLEHFSDELIRVRIRGANERTRLAVHVARYPNWRATLDGEPVRIAGGHLGLPRADLMHLQVRDGLLELRYRRGPVDVVGAIVSILALLTIIALALSRVWKGPERLLEVSRLRTVAGRMSPTARAIAVCGAGLLSLTLILGLRGRADGGDEEASGGEPLAGLLDRAQVWLVQDGARHPLLRRWDGRFGHHLPPEIIVDRHVEALALGDPRRVVAARVGANQEAHIRFEVEGVRGLRGSFARGGRGREETVLEVWLGHERIGRFSHGQLGDWREFEAETEAAASPLELVVRASGAPGRAVLIDANLIR